MAKIMKKTYKKKISSKPKVVYVQKAPDEIKELVTSVTGVVPVGGYLLAINQLANGSESGQRIGRAVQPQRLSYRFVILGASSSGLIDYLRVMLVYDAAPNGVGASTADFLETTAGGNLTTMLKNTRSYPKRFTFLYDKTIPVQNQSSGGSCNGDKEDQVQTGSIPLNKFPVTRFPGITAVVPNSGAIYLVVFSYQNTGLVTTSAGLYGHFKFQYTDE